MWKKEKRKINAVDLVSSAIFIMRSFAGKLDNGSKCKILPPAPVSVTTSLN